MEYLLRTGNERKRWFVYRRWMILECYEYLKVVLFMFSCYFYALVIIIIIFFVNGQSYVCGCMCVRVLKEEEEAQVQEKCKLLRTTSIFLLYRTITRCRSTQFTEIKCIACT